MPLNVSFKGLSLSLSTFPQKKHHLHLLFWGLTPSPPVADWLFGLPLVGVFHECVSCERVADVGPGEDGAGGGT